MATGAAVTRRATRTAARAAGVAVAVASRDEVEVLGLDPSRDGLEVRRRVGYVPEVPALYDWMTVAEIGWFAAGFHPDASGSTAPYQTRYSEQVQVFGLPPKRRIKELSKGMRSKV